MPVDVEDGEPTYRRAEASGQTAIRRMSVWLVLLLATAAILTHGSDNIVQASGVDKRELH